MVPHNWGDTALQTDMGLIVQNMIAKWEILSLIKLMALQSGAVEYLLLIKVEWVKPEVSCLSLWGEHGAEEEHLQPPAPRPPHPPALSPKKERGFLALSSASH